MWKRDTSPRPVVDTPPLKPAQTPAAVQTPPPAPSRIESRPVENVVMNLGKSIMIKGELCASEDLTLYGQMEGRVTLPDHTLTIGPDADIQADVVANAVVVMGAVEGKVTAGKRVEIRSTGSVNGDIVSPNLVMHEGGQLQGKVEMHRAKPQK